ncbi:MAG: sugar-binding protein, partial [Armatimonadota bacterium]
MRWVSALVFLLTVASLSVAQELIAFQIAPPPIADGQINDIAWTKALTLQLNHRLGDGEPQAKTTVKFCFGSEHIFALFVCEEPNPQAMRRRIKQHDGEVWTDDCVEIFLAPDPNEPASYYHIVVNSLGVVRDEFWQDGKDDESWDSKARVGVSVESDRWIAEVAIPIRSLNRVPMFSNVWRVNFARQRYSVSPPELSTWQPCKSSFHEPQNFSSLRLDKFVALPLVRRISATVVQQEANRLKDLLRTWQKRLPANLRTSIGKRTASALSEWQGKLGAKDLENLWAQIKALQTKLPQLEAEVARARVVEQVGKPYAVFAVSPMLKLRPEQIPTGEPISQRNPITLFAARGEGESIQIVVAALEQTLKNVKVNASPLVGPKGNLIFPEIRLVGYVPVQKPTPGGFGIVGRYPDPLLPLRNFDVMAGECQSVWLTVWVPRDAES